MRVRQVIGYNYISFPFELKGALKVRFADGYLYCLSEDDDERERELRYISLYKGDIFDNIFKTFHEYVENNSETIDQLKRRYLDRRYSGHSGDL